MGELIKRKIQRVGKCSLCHGDIGKDETCIALENHLLSNYYSPVLFHTKCLLESVEKCTVAE